MRSRYLALGLRARSLRTLPMKPTIRGAKTSTGYRDPGASEGARVSSRSSSLSIGFDDASLSR
jgi:hypothetical protein